MKKTLIAPIFFSLFLFSCASKKEASETQLYGPTWELEFLSGPRIAFHGLFPKKKPQISFNPETKRASGNDSCNGYSAPFTISGNEISFGEPGPSTLMYCGKGESFFRKTIREVDHFRFDEQGHLELLRGDIPMMRFINLGAQAN